MPVIRRAHTVPCMSPMVATLFADEPAHGHYLTDGHRLYRVVSPFLLEGGDPTAELEDCLTLEVRPYTAHELLVMGLFRVVREPLLATV